jgi:predicted regulator of Ras-like GTPase activity (Roadblock/LC7/MglB family)
VFREVLQDIVRRADGCLGALIMGTDGISVEKVWQPDAAATNLEVAVAEFASLIKNARRANGEMGLGQLQEATFSSDGGVFILRFASRDYFIAAVLSPTGNFGRARYELSRAELLLKKELSV